MNERMQFLEKTKALQFDLEHQRDFLRRRLEFFFKLATYNTEDRIAEIERLMREYLATITNLQAIGGTL